MAQVVPDYDNFNEVISNLRSTLNLQNNILHLIAEYVGPAEVVGWPKPARAPVPASSRFQAMIFNRKQAEKEHWITNTFSIHFQMLIWLALIISQVTFVVVLANEPKESFVIGRWMFLRFVGLNFLFAFISFWRQFDGLAGSNGINPASDALDSTLQLCQANELSKWSYFPTLYWLNSSDIFINISLFIAIILSLMTIIPLPFISSPVFLILTFLYQSIKPIGGDFMSFQWDSLLTEIGFLASMIEWQALFSVRSSSHPWIFDGWSMRLMVVCINSLHFRLMFTSGICKLASNCYFWRSGTAMNLHYWTQPLPHTGGYLANKISKISCLGPLQNHATIWFESFFSILILVPIREVRLIGSGSIFMLMLLIFFTGNYGFFNLLTVPLFVATIDDELWPSAMKNWIFGFNLKQMSVPKVIEPVYNLGSERVIIADIIALVPCSIYFVSAMVVGYCMIRKSFRNEAISSWRCIKRFLVHVQMMGIFGSYGLFASMTAFRHEIVIEGTIDGQEWKAYEFKYKPGDLNRAPIFVPFFHMPRLDWQMWFLPLGPYNQRRAMWYLQFLSALVNKKKPVLQLLKHNPFPDNPPNLVRGWLYDYRFCGDELGFGSGTTTDEEFLQWERGQWWSRRNLGTAYGPTVRGSKILAMGARYNQ